MKTAAEWLAVIDANEGAYCSRRVTYEEYRALQRTTWDAIRDEGDETRSAVLALLRDRCHGARRVA